MKALRRSALVIFVIAGLLSAGYLVYPGFISSSGGTAPTDESTLDKTQPQDLASFYSQKPVWKDCEGSNTNARCGDIQVPLDWNNPGAGSINIAVAINPTATPNSSPYLLMNPGGPGGSGRDWVLKYLSSLGTKKLRDSYNIVGFDPRGVGASSSVKCYSVEKTKSFLYDSSPYELGSDQDINFSKNAIKDYGQACLKNTGALLGHVDTPSAARDMDIIRAVLGSKKLNYLGFSYGTLLGLTYAAYFPKNVGRFVLDGVVDPTVTPSEDSLNQLRGFQSAMKAYLADCIKNTANCPFKGLSVDAAMDKIGTDFLGYLEKKTVVTTEKGRELSLNSGFTGMIAALYSKDNWTYLTQAFQEFFKAKKDGRIFILLADMYFAYDDNTNTFDGNENDAFRAINCLDSRESGKMSDMIAQNKKALQVSKVFGRYWQYGGLACYSWPFNLVPSPKDYSAKDAPSMLVVGTTNDPATPYSQAVNVANKVLAHGRLLTYKGEGHTAYGSSNSCVDNTVDDFLIKGTLPNKNKTC